MVYKFNDFQLRWLEALESDKYSRGRYYIRLGRRHSDGAEFKDEYCCLGVAVDLYDPDGWTEVESTGTHKIYSYKDVETVALPREVQKALRLSTMSGNVREKYTNLFSFESLIDANDSEEMSFKKIAAILREHPECFFEEHEDDVQI